MTKTLKKNTAKTTAKKIIQEKRNVSKIIQKILKPHSAQDKKLILNILKKGKIDKTLKKNKQGKKKKTKKKSKDVNVSAVKINIELTKHLLRVNNLTKNYNGPQSALNKELKKDKHKDKDVEQYIKLLFPKKLRAGGIISTIVDTFKSGPTGILTPEEIEKRRKIKQAAKIIGGISAVAGVALGVSYGVDWIHDAKMGVDGLHDDHEGDGSHLSSGITSHKDSPYHDPPLLFGNHGGQGAAYNDLDGDGKSNTNDDDVDGDGVINDQDTNDDGWDNLKDLDDDEINQRIEDFCETNPECHEPGQLLGVPVNDDGTPLEPGDFGYHGEIHDVSDFRELTGTGQGVGDSIDDLNDTNKWDADQGQDEFDRVHYPPCQDYYFDPSTGLGNANCVPKADGSADYGTFEDCCDIGTHVIENAEKGDNISGDGETEGQNEDLDQDSKLCEQTAVGMTGAGDMFCRQRHFQLNHDGKHFTGELDNGEFAYTEGGPSHGALIYFNPAQPITDGQGEDAHYDDLGDDSLVYERCCFSDTADGVEWGNVTDTNLKWPDSTPWDSPGKILNTENPDSDLGETIKNNMVEYNAAVKDADKTIPDEIFEARTNQQYISAANNSAEGRDWLAGEEDELLAEDGIQRRARWFTDYNEQHWSTVDRGDLVQGSGSTGEESDENGFGSSQDDNYHVKNTRPSGEQYLGEAKSQGTRSFFKDTIGALSGP